MDNSPKASASPKSRTKKPKQLDFFEALREVSLNKCITKLEWNEPNCYLKLVDGRLVIYKPDTKLFHPLIVSDGDMAGEDWIVIDPTSTSHKEVSNPQAIQKWD